MQVVSAGLQLWGVLGRLQGSYGLSSTTQLAHFTCLPTNFFPP